jgi:hypothetical protein
LSREVGNGALCVVPTLLLSNKVGELQRTSRFVLSDLILRSRRSLRLEG